MVQKHVVAVGMELTGGRGSCDQHSDALCQAQHTEYCGDARLGQHAQHACAAAGVTSGYVVAWSPPPPPRPPGAPARQLVNPPGRTLSISHLTQHKDLPPHFNSTNIAPSHTNLSNFLHSPPTNCPPIHPPAFHYSSMMLLLFLVLSTGCLGGPCGTPSLC
jgi:hypothetical protein